MFLGLDLGTTNVKAAVADHRGQILGQGSAPVALFHVAGGGVEQEISEIWSATRAAMRQATAELDAARILAVGVSSQGGALQLLDAQRAPVGRVISWLDDRGRADDEAFVAACGRQWFIQRIGHGRGGMAIGQLLRLRRESPSRLRPPNRVGFVGDIIVERLCGRAAQDGTAGGLTLLYNPRLRTYDPALLERLEIDADQLPDLLSPREAAGGLRSDVARETGLPAGTPVSPAVHDQYAAALGMGVVHVGEVMFGAGTAWVLLVVMDRLADPAIDDAFVCPHVVEGLYGQILSLRNGGSAVTWALQLLGLAKHRRAEIERLIASAPPGADGVCFWPFLGSFGASGLPAGIKGQWSGLQFSHTPASLIRSVVEGLACELNRHLLFLRDAQIPVERLIMGGAAAASPTTPQVVADLSGLPVVCSPSGDVSVAGALIIARGLTEHGPSLAGLAGEMIPPGRLIEPGADASVYQGLFKRYLDAVRRPGI